MAVPMIDLRAQYRSIKPEIDAAVAEVFESQGFVGGPKVEQFESAIARYLGVEHSLSVASGTDALLLALKAAGVKEGDEVITTTFSFFATAGAIANAGAKPVFVDIDPATFNIDVTRIESHITDRTRAIVPVHLYGQCADMDPIMAIAARHGLRVIEDAAQSLGARYKDRHACTLGNARPAMTACLRTCQRSSLPRKRRAIPTCTTSTSSACPGAMTQRCCSHERKSVAPCSIRSRFIANSASSISDTRKKISLPRRAHAKRRSHYRCMRS